MGFYARSFQFDGIPSETYNLLISEIDGSAEDETMGSSTMEIKSQKIYKKPVPYFYGMTPAENLSFDISAFTPDEEIDALSFQLIQAWLFSSRTYKKLLIFQEDMMDGIYFNCIFNNPKIIRVGNKIVGFTATIECDAPYGWNFPKTTTYTYTTPTVDNGFVFNNTSNDKGVYLYPDTVITMNAFGGSVTITNASDSSRVFSFTGMSPNEVITVDNNLQTISSSTGLLRLSNFNKHFLRLIPGVNNLRIQGNVSSLAMTTQTVSKKLGG